MIALRTGVGLAAVLVVAGAIPAFDVEPDAAGRYGILSLGVAIGSIGIAIATLALIVPAWRGSRRAASAVAALQLVAILPSLPAYVASEAPPMAQAAAAGGAVLNVTAFFLVMLGFTQRLGRAEATAEHLRDSRATIVAAREQERSELHQELHDGVGTTLTSAMFRADAAQRLLRESPAEASAQLALSRGELRIALSELRRVVRGLRPIELEQYGLWQALDRRAVGAVRVRVEIELPSAPPELSPAVELATYRIVAEALSNVERHSNGSRAKVRITTGVTALEIDVTDDGTPSTHWHEGVGMRSICARAEELQGDAAIGPGPNGWSVRVRLPLG